MISFTADGEHVVLDADGTEARIIADLASQLDEMLAARSALTASGMRAEPAGLPDDPALARLLPDMINGDVDAAHELRGLVEPSLVAMKRENVRLVTLSLEQPGALDSATEDAWARLLSDLRLTIAARLDIESDDDLDALAASDQPSSVQTLAEVYTWLGGLLEHLIGTLDARDDRKDSA